MSDVYACMYKQACKTRGSGGIRRSEIASEAILGQKQSRSSYMAPGVLFVCPCMHLLSQLTFNSQERRYLGWHLNSRWGDITRKTTGELFNTWNSDLLTHTFMRILSS